LTDNVKELTASTQRWLDAGPPPLPAWLSKLPVVGRRAAETWKGLEADRSKWQTQAQRAVEKAGAGLLKMAVLVGNGLFQIALSILVAFFLLRNGPELAETLTTAVERIAQERGRHLLVLAATTMRGVVYGILGTAVLQAVMAGVGLLVAGVPWPGLLALAVFFLSVVPAGPFLIMAPAALWLFNQGATGWGVFILVWGLAVGTLDNFVRPWLISQGSDMPFVLILLGVLGGALTFGFIGVFIGPTLLAVGHRLVSEWAAVPRVDR
jgi:predicted PurR-regulated permease PerM